MKKVELVNHFGFRGRGGFVLKINQKIQGGAKKLSEEVAELPEYWEHYPSGKDIGPHPWIAKNDKVPDIIHPGTYQLGYRLTDDPYEHGGTGEGEFYFG